MTQADIQEMHVCNKCGKKFTPVPPLYYNLCDECMHGIYTKLEEFWVCDVLGFDLELREFAPQLPQILYGLSLKDYHVDERMRSEVDAKIRLHSDIRVRNLDMKGIAEMEKEKLLTKGISGQTRTCQNCSGAYTVDGIWAYTICQKCAKLKKYEWENFYVTEVIDYGDDYIGFIPTPPMDVSKYLIKTKEDSTVKMNKDDASRIQSHADRTGQNQDFKSRAQSAAARNEGE